jgi:chemotaxis signal transduction protein
MSSAAENKQWTISGLWAIQKSSEPSLSQPGRDARGTAESAETQFPQAALALGTALPNKARSGIAGQIGEHLNYAARRRASSHPSAPLPMKQAIIRETSVLTSSEAPSEDTPPAVRALPILPTAQTTLSEEKQQASDTPDDQQPASQPEGTPYLTFRLGKLRWAIPVVYLREALPDVPAITPLPFSPLWLHGLINLRGEAVGLINLSELLLDPVIAASAARTDGIMPAVVAEYEGVSLALQVQELGEVLFLEESLFRHLSGAQTRSLPTFAVTHLQAAWFSAQSQSPLLLLDLPRMMTSLLEYMTAKEALGDG